MIITEEDAKYIKSDLELIRDTKSSGTYTSYKIDQTIEYIEQLENRIKELEEKTTSLETRGNYYKQRYLEFNDYFLKNNMNVEQMLKELKRSKLYERSTEDDIQSKEDTNLNNFSRRTHDRERAESSKRNTV